MQTVFSQSKFQSKQKLHQSGLIEILGVEVF